ncbi:hypothetical protein [Rubritalea profundi]|uniref:hypothetical protein n=1 Tax=Rubritalea profundi TaxID=1658618 RepID=UPI0013FD48E3|nr:hypothetical protein [Rubritalea profundi]
MQIETLLRNFDQLIQLELDDGPIDFEIIAAWHPHSANDPSTNGSFNYCRINTS